MEQVYYDFSFRLTSSIFRCGHKRNTGQKTKSTLIRDRWQIWKSLFLRYDFKLHCCISRNLNKGRNLLPSLSGKPSGLVQGPRVPPKAPVPLQAFPPSYPGRHPSHSLAAEPCTLYLCSEGARRVAGNGERLVQPRPSPMKKRRPETPVWPLPGLGESHLKANGLGR